MITYGINIQCCCECGNDLSHKCGQIVCPNCGLVKEARCISTDQAQIFYSNEEWENKARTGGKIVVSNGEGSYRTFADSNDADFRRIFKRNGWGDSQTITKGRNKIEALIGQLRLPSYIKWQAFLLYRKAYKRDVLRGRSVENIVGACIYYCVRKNEIPVFRYEIENYLDCESSLTASVRALIKEFDLKFTPFKFKTFITKALSLCDLNGYGLEMELKEVLDKFPKTRGYGPEGVFGAAIYVLGIKHPEAYRTQEYIANKLNTTSVSMRRHIKTIKKIMGKIENVNNYRTGL
jgi:transcription initiation factor TFIIB